MEGAVGLKMETYTLRTYSSFRIISSHEDRTKLVAPHEADF
jgi:hypothetical protein